jgi:hypothetical protein
VSGARWVVKDFGPDQDYWCGYQHGWSRFQRAAFRFETKVLATEWVQRAQRFGVQRTKGYRIVRLVPKRRPMPNLDGWARDTEATQQKVAKSLREASPYDAQRQYEEQRLQNLRAAQPPPSHATVAEVRELIEKRARAEEREAICRFLEDDSMGWRKAAEWIRVHGEAISRSFRSGAHRSGAK